MESLDDRCYNVRSLNEKDYVIIFKHRSCVVLTEFRPKIPGLSLNFQQRNIRSIILLAEFETFTSLWHLVFVGGLCVNIDTASPLLFNADLGKWIHMPFLGLGCLKVPRIDAEENVLYY